MPHLNSHQQVVVRTEDVRDLLPDNVKPEHYSLELSNICTEAPWTYNGRVEILLRIQRPTNVIVLNSHELKIDRAELVVGGAAHKSSDIVYDVPLQRCTLHFEEWTQPSSHETILSIWFEGYMNEYMAGFYRSEYDIPDNTKGSTSSEESSEEDSTFMFSTQFEPSEARRAFPCFDEPASKATFDLQIEVPPGMTALSNMPVVDSRTSSHGQETRTIFSFARSPRMSTYLLAWAIGRFEYVEQILHRKQAAPLPIRVYTTEGLSDQGKRGLNVACKVIEYFTEMFDIEYPLPKLDLIAVHEMSDDAMENWGLVTFEPSALLYDEETSDPYYLGHLTYIVAHELAHQWFGNITTMEWWDELWLNEGFATWAGWCACDHMHPEWNVWATFAAEDLRQAFDLDALRSSHPIQVPIPDGREVDAIFDSISYLKSAAVIRMLAARLGLPKFLKGVSDYLKANAYGNATAVALWEALEKASGQEVVSVMRSWVQAVGFPVLTISDAGASQVRIRQDRFLFAGEATPEEQATTWCVPIHIQSENGIRQIDLAAREATLPRIDSEEFLRLNTRQMGFYVTQSSPEALQKLCENVDQASVEDQVGLLTDVAALAIRGHGATTTADVLSVVSAMGKTPVYAVYNIMLYCLDRIQSIFADDDEISDGVDKLAETILGPVARGLGWTVGSKDDLLKVQLRAVVLEVAGLSGHKWTINEALQLWDQFRQSRAVNVIHPSLRGSVFAIAIQRRGSEAIDVLKEEYDNGSSPDSGEIVVEAMGQVATAELANTCLTFALGGGMSSSDTSDLMIQLAKNPVTRETVWRFMRDNWSQVHERFGGSAAVMLPVVCQTLQVFTTNERRSEIEAFFRDKDTTGYTRGLTIALECISINAAYRTRDRDVVRSWLKTHGYV